MTREEAIKGLKVLRRDFSGYKPNEEMFDMAIEALQTPPISQRSMYQAGYKQAQEDRPKGKWVDEDGTYYANCSKCGYQMDTHQERGYFRYCPNCGADMRSTERSE